MNSGMKNHRRQNFVEAFGVRYPRVVCARCCLPCVYLGEAIRVDMAEGGHRILHVCIACVRRFRLGAAHSSHVNHGSSIKAA